MRKALVALVAAVIAVLVGVGIYSHVHSGTNPYDPKNHPKVKVAKLEDPGPGRCIPGNAILKELRKQKPGGDFKPPYTKTERDVLATQEIAWVQVHTTTPCVKAMAKYVKVKPAALPKWFKDHSLQEVGKDGITVQNSYFQQKGKKKGQIVWIKRAQTLPKGELVWKDGDKPVFKFVCGNALGPPKKVKAAVKSKKSTPKPKKTTVGMGCTGSKCGSGTPPPPPSCKSDCGTPPSPSCTHDCGSNPPPKCTGSDCDHNPPPCTKDCGTPPPSCTGDNCNPPQQSCPCLTKAAVNDATAPQKNDKVLAAAVEPTKDVSKAPVIEQSQPVNNRTAHTKAPNPMPNGSDSGSGDGHGTPSGSTSDHGGTSTGDTPTTQPVDTHQGGDNGGLPGQPS